MNVLVGVTGFVGSNLYETGAFEAAYHSKNVEEAFGTKPDLLVYAGVRAEKYLANAEPEQDMEHIRQAQENICRIYPQKLVLISTIDVFSDSEKADETTVVNQEELQSYGANRYKLEQWARDYLPDCLIIRLPGLFGKNLKKNFIYDFMNPVPCVLRKEKMEELEAKESALKDYYQFQNNGFFKVKNLEENEKKILKKLFRKVGFSSLNFTDSRSIYQFYPLSRLWSDIQIALKNEIRLWHGATEPISAGELYQYLTEGQKFINELPQVPVKYDFRTIYGELFCSQNTDGYISRKYEVMESIKNFVGSR